jgi:hypothetical protein
MTPEEKQKRIEALEAEIAELKKPEKTAGQRLWELVSGTEIKFDFETYPNRIFGFRGNKYVWELDFRFKNYYLWIRYEELWTVLTEEFGPAYDDVQSLVKNEVESHFNCEEITLVIAGDGDAGKVESHFNGRSEAKELEGLTDFQINVINMALWLLIAVTAAAATFAVLSK